MSSSHLLTRIVSIPHVLSWFLCMSVLRVPVCKCVYVGAFAGIPESRSLTSVCVCVSVWACAPVLVCWCLSVCMHAWACACLFIWWSSSVFSVASPFLPCSLPSIPPSFHSTRSSSPCRSITSRCSYKEAQPGVADTSLLWSLYTDTMCYLCFI